MFNDKQLKRLSDRQIIVLFWEIWVAESNGDVRIILTKSPEIAHYAVHIWLKVVQNDWRDVGSFQFAKRHIYLAN